MLRNEENHEDDKNRNMDIGWDDPRIEIVGLDGVDDRDHGDHEESRYSSTISICDDEDRDSWDECTKNRDKSEYEYDEREGKNKWKYMSTMDQTDDEESNGSEESIHNSDEWLGPQDRSESVSDLASDDRIFLIEKCKVPSLHLSEECYDRLAFYHKNIREEESDEELGQDDSSIAEISESRLSDGFEILSIDDIADHLTEPEVDLEALLYSIHKALELSCNLWCPIDELSHLTDDLWDDRDKEEWDDQDKEDIEYRHYYIGIVISECEFCSLVAMPMESPGMDDTREPGSTLEKQICEEEGDEKKKQKVR